MNRLYLVFVSFLAWGSWAFAQTPADEPTSYLLLAGDHGVLRGRVTDTIDQVVVVQPGGEIRLPKARVACWSTDLAGLYQYQLDNRQRADLSEHLRLAQWCLRNEYAWGAVREMAAASLLAPQDPRLEQLRRQLAELERAGEAAADDETEGDPSPVDTVKIRMALTEELPLSRIKPESLRQNQLEAFTVSVQPILNNRCATAACHGGSSTIFRLQQSTIGSARPSAALTKENLASVLRWIDSEHPLASPLLVRATSVHGGLDEPPLGMRAQTAKERLRQWVQSVAAPTTGPVADGRLAASPTADGFSSTNVRSDAPVPLPHLEDPFDPAVFHRKVHSTKRSQ